MTDGATIKPKSAPEGLASGQGSLFGALGDAELLRIRLRPAAYARLICASKQSVSRWIRAGWIPVSPIDGTIDPREATAALLRRGDAHRLRSRVLRSAAEELGTLRAEAAKVATLAAELAAARAALAKAEAERDRLAARLADAEVYADSAAAELFKLKGAAE
jgi:hypothetical protein